MENTIQSSKKKYLINFGTNCISTFLSILYYLCTYKYKLFQEPFPDIIFQIHLRRKTLFYVVNLIIPCVGISFLSVLVFYLPSDSGRQIDNMRQIDNIGQIMLNTYICKELNYSLCWNQFPICPSFLSSFRFRQIDR